MTKLNDTKSHLPDINQIYSEYGSNIYGILLMRTQNEEIASSLLQEVFGCIKAELNNSIEVFTFSKIMQIVSRCCSKQFPFQLNRNFNFSQNFLDMSEKELSYQIFSMIFYGGATADDLTGIIYKSKPEIMKILRNHLKKSVTN